MGWTMKDIERLKAEGKIRDYKIIGDTRADQKPKRAKYGSVKVEYAGITFDSRKEYNRYRELLLLLKAGHIGQLRLQVKYELIAKQDGERKTEYWADFVYVDALTGTTIVEDVKSEATRKKESYIIKRKLMLKIHNIKIKEV